MRITKLKFTDVVGDKKSFDIKPGQSVYFSHVGTTDDDVIDLTIVSDTEEIRWDLCRDVCISVLKVPS